MASERHAGPIGKAAKRSGMATIASLAEKVGLPFEGDGTLEISGVSHLNRAREGDLSFVQSEAYVKQALDSPARAVIAPEGMDVPGKTVIRSPYPQLTLARITTLLHPLPERKTGIDPRAAIGEGCRIAPSATIHPMAVAAEGVAIGERSEVYPGVYLGVGVVVGDDCVLHANVTVEWGCRIGNRVVIYAGTVIGSDGFGFLPHEGRHEKIPHVGNVVIEDDVEIGANCAIDRSTYRSTVIGKGTKMDNLVHIAHNVDVGPYSLFSGQTGIAGTSKVGEYFTIGGQAGVAGHLELGDRITVGPKSIMTRPGTPGEIYYGFPARPAHQWRQSIAQFNALPRLVNRINRLLGSKAEDSEQ